MHVAKILEVQVSPAKAPQVVGALLDVEAPDDFITNLILSIRSLIPVEALCAEVWPPRWPVPIHEPRVLAVQQPPLCMSASRAAGRSLLSHTLVHQLWEAVSG